MSDMVSNNIDELKGAPLFKFITSYRNIYRAIYALESYIDELYLLGTKADRSNAKKNSTESDSQLHNKSDLELYYILHDKYNWNVINEVITACQARIEDVILKSDEYFETSVFFSLKKYDTEKEKLRFRPLHTASLVDQICMVAMLQVLMFEDNDEIDDIPSAMPRRFPSDLLKSIPDNFYGNRGSLKLERIYEKWAPNYQAYNQKIVESCTKYSRSHKYEYEVSLDIKEFFPSISPFYLFVKICDILKERYRNKVNKFTESDPINSEEKIYHQNLTILKRATAKLLFLKVKDGDKIIDPAFDYYGDEGAEPRFKDHTDLFAKGVAQGLPQSYFFGNLCMTDVRRKIMGDDMFKGKDYFYVDDSVIYVKGYDEDLKNQFNDKIKKLNKALEELASIEELELRWETSLKDSSDCSSLFEDLKKYCGKAIDFHKKLEDKYKIVFHEDGKSSIQTIDVADRVIKSMGGLGRNASGTSSIFTEGDDRRISKEKMNALNDYAWNIIKQKEQENGAHVGKTVNNDNTLQLKVFKRFRKIFLSRNMWLDTMDSGNIEEGLKDWFLRLLTPEGLEIRNKYSSPVEMAEDSNVPKVVSVYSSDMVFSKGKKELWFELTDKESFRAEALQLLKCSSLEYARELKDQITKFEESFSTVHNSSSSHLYFHKYIEGVISARTISGDK